MSAKSFVTELEKYFVDYTLSDVDKSAILAMFDRHAPTAFAIVREKVVKERIQVEKPVYIQVPYLIYPDAHSDEDKTVTKLIRKMVPPNLLDIATVVCDECDITVDQLKRTSKVDAYFPLKKSSAKFVRARTRFILAALQKYPFSFSQIAEFIGYKSHSDVSKIARGIYTGSVSKRFRGVGNIPFDSAAKKVHLATYNKEIGGQN